MHGLVLEVFLRGGYSVGMGRPPSVQKPPRGSCRCFLSTSHSNGGLADVTSEQDAWGLRMVLCWRCFSVGATPLAWADPPPCSDLPEGVAVASYPPAIQMAGWMM